MRFQTTITIEFDAGDIDAAGGRLRAFIDALAATDAEVLHAGPVTDPEAPEQGDWTMYGPPAQ